MPWVSCQRWWGHCNVGRWGYERCLGSRDKASGLKGEAVIFTHSWGFRACIVMNTSLRKSQCRIADKCPFIVQYFRAFNLKRDLFSLEMATGYQAREPSSRFCEVAKPREITLLYKSIGEGGTQWRSFLTVLTRVISTSTCYFSRVWYTRRQLSLQTGKHLVSVVIWRLVNLRFSL